MSSRRWSSVVCWVKRRKADSSRKSGDEILTLDLSSLEYRPRMKPKFASVEAARNIEDLGERLSSLVYAKDRAGEFLWRTISETLIYAANRIPEIADSIVEIDNAMKWGFAHELGVFETWDAIGVEKSVAQTARRRSSGTGQCRKDACGWSQELLQGTRKERATTLILSPVSTKPERALPGVTIIKSLKGTEP